MGRRRKLKRWVKYVLIPGFLLGLTVGLLWLMKPESPESAIRIARENLSAARDAQAGKYVPREYEKAVTLYASAIVLWKKENVKLFFLRDYKSVSALASESATLAQNTLSKATHSARTAHNETAESLENLVRQIRRFEKVYGPLPLSDQMRDQFNQSKLIVEEIRIAREKRYFHKASELLKRADALIEKSEKSASAMLKEFFSHFDDWESIYQKSIETSARNNSVLIVVDKMAHELLLFRDGKVRSTFKTEFGPRWLGDKNHQGDQATPEGSYVVTKKKEKRHTRYYKALLLNYPNQEDMARYRKNVASGKIPRHIDVGGLIEIHGHGGQGFNWTNGCVALSDRDMDVVYRNALVNTPVVIIGSRIPMDEWIELKLAE